jgi:hypothetical protein
VTAHARPGVNFMKPKGLVAAALNHFPDVDAQPVAHSASSLTLEN